MLGKKWAAVSVMARAVCHTTSLVGCFDTHQVVPSKKYTLPLSVAVKLDPGAKG